MDRSKDSRDDRSITGADFLQLNLADAPPGRLSDALTRKLREAIADGRLPVGARLPATRVLAGELRVSRGVVTEAYQRLAEEGRVAGRGRAGTIVVAAPVSPPEPRVSTAPAAFPVVPDAAEFQSFRELSAPIDLSPGVPDLAAFPRSAWLRAERTVLDRLSPSDFGYGDPCGTPVFRRAVANWLARLRGVAVDPEDVLVVAGVAQALTLLGIVLTRQGISTVAVEDPGSLGAREQLRGWGVRTPPVPVDEGGLRVDELRRDGASAVLLTPAHQFPTGVVLDGARRRELLRWARDGGLVIEDDYDAEHRYDRPPVPALRSMLAEHVCYAGSVSKLLAPALRVGWLLVPRRYRSAVVAVKRESDLGNSVLPQLVLAELMESGELERQLRLLRRRHRRRRDVLIAALRRHLPNARLHGAAAGLHLMVTFDDAPDDVALAAAALERGVKVQPLSWHRQRPGAPGLVIGYASGSPGDLEHGVATLAAVLA